MLNYFKSLLTLAILLYLESSTLAGSLQEIQHRGKLRVGIKDNSPPLGFYNSQGQLVGLEIDLAREIALELLGSRDAVEFLPLLNQDRLASLLDGKVDMIIADLSITVSRQRLVSFIDYYYLDGTGLIATKPEIERLEDLKEKKIAVLEESSAIAVLKSSLPSAQLVGVKSYQEGFNLLQNNQVDAMAADRSILVGWRQNHPLDHLLPERLSVAPLSIALPKGLQYNELQKKVTKVMETSKKSGWLKQRLIYWGLP